MPKCLFFTCPTDCLEQTINSVFTHQNYFYNSLGNSLIYNKKTLESIWELVEKHHIEEIYFVLSIDNKIVLDALENNEFSNIRTLSNFYTDIETQRERVKMLLQGTNSQFAFLSYFLNKRIKELKQTNLFRKPIKIKGLVYNGNKYGFKNIYSHLVCLEEYHLN